MRLGEVSALPFHSANPARSREMHSADGDFHAVMRSDTRDTENRGIVAQNDPEELQPETEQALLEDTEASEDAECDDCVDIKLAEPHFRETKRPEPKAVGSLETSIRLGLYQPEPEDSDNQIQMPQYLQVTEERGIGESDQVNKANDTFAPPSISTHRIPVSTEINAKAKPKAHKVAERLTSGVDYKQSVIRDDFAAIKIDAHISQNETNSRDASFIVAQKLSENLMHTKGEFNTGTASEIFSVKNTLTSGNLQLEGMPAAPDNDRNAFNLSQRINDQLTSEIVKQLSAGDLKTRSATMSDYNFEVSGDKFLRKLQISLHPVELGKVRILFSTTDGGIQVNFIVERIETLELMRRYAHYLMKDLENAGLNNISLGFTSDQDQRSHNKPDHLFKGSIARTANENTPQKQTDTDRRVPSNRLVDIRV